MDQNQPWPSAESGDEADYRERRVRRHPLDEPASLTPERTCRIEVKVRDLSPFGFMAECDETVSIGSYVALDVPGMGPVHAQVRWQVGRRMGGMFLDPISLVRCEWTAIKDSLPTPE
jgi:hypothetical protein